MQPGTEKAGDDQTETATGGTKRWRVLLALAVVALGGLGLILFANTPDDTGDDTADETAGAGSESISGGRTLDLSDTDAEAVSELAGLSLPESTAEFLTARLDDDSQLDVTFTIDPTDETALLEGSGIPEPVAGERVIFHSSPLWELNAQGTIRGATSSGARGIRRSVELVEEDDVVRVRLVITPA